MRMIFYTELERRIELQEMIFVQEFYANDGHYDISDIKTKVFIANSVLSTEKWNETEWKRR